MYVMIIIINRNYVESSVYYFDFLYFWFSALFKDFYSQD